MATLPPYELIIGLEVHVQLNTASKAFSRDRNVFGLVPNTCISPVSLAYPGTLPMLNEREVEAAVLLGLAFGSHINPFSSFDRKSYFYADMPKGYQITQEEQPVCLGGFLPIRLRDGQSRSVRINRVHMEEDAGKSLHDQDEQYSLIDLNRAGTPLLEVVTEPDLRSPEEVEAFMTRMRQLVRYLGISDGNMQEGSLRCDCNISLRRAGDPILGTRCEVKNLNSMKFARKAILYEAGRQRSLLEQGKPIVRQTLQFHPETGRTTPMRDKEAAHDYRYFPEPDLPPLRIPDDRIQEIKDSLPLLPWQAEERLMTEFGIREELAVQLAARPAPFAFFVEVARLSPDTELVANFMVQKLLPALEGPEEQALQSLSIDKVSALLLLVSEGRVANSIVYERLFPAWMEDPSRDPVALAEALDLLLTSDEDALSDLVQEILYAHPDQVGAFRSGKKGLIGFFMGELMKMTGGKADPRLGRTLLLRELEEWEG